MDRRTYTVDDYRYLFRSLGNQISVTRTELEDIIAYDWMHLGHQKYDVFPNEITVKLNNTPVLRGFVEFNGYGYTVGFCRQKHTSIKLMLTCFRVIFDSLRGNLLDAYTVKDDEIAVRFVKKLGFQEECDIIGEGLVLHRGIF